MTQCETSDKKRPSVKKRKLKRYEHVIRTNNLYTAIQRGTTLSKRQRKNGADTSLSRVEHHFQIDIGKKPRHMAVTGSMLSYAETLRSYLKMALMGMMVFKTQAILVLRDIYQTLSLFFLSLHYIDNHDTPQLSFLLSVKLALLGPLFVFVVLLLTICSNLLSSLIAAFYCLLPLMIPASITLSNGSFFILYPLKR